MSFVSDIFSGGGGGALGAIGGGIGSILGGQQSSNAAQAGQAAADPFASQRGQYQTMLSDLMKNPSSIYSNPAYQAQLNQGLMGVQGSASAHGMLNSGNTLSSLMNYGQGSAANFYQQQEQDLAQLSGATIGSPSAAASYASGGSAAASGGLTSGIGGILGGLGSLFGGGSSGGGFLSSLFGGGSQLIG